MSTYEVQHHAFDANARGVMKDHHTPMSTYEVQHHAFDANARGVMKGPPYAYVNVWGTYGEQCSKPGKMKGILTISATRMAVSKRVGKSSFSMKELTEGVCLNALDRCRHIRVLSGSPGPCV